VLLLGHFRETTVAIADASGDGLTWNQGTYISNASGADQSLEIDWALNDNVAVTDKTLTLTTPGGSVGSAGFMIFLKETAAAANLVITDGANAHAADNVVLTQEHVLAVADGAHAHAADNMVLTTEQAVVAVVAMAPRVAHSRESFARAWR
jgi:membrane-bound ClpP family serine protease